MSLQSGALLWTTSAHFGPVNLLAVDSLHGIVFSVKGNEMKKWWVQVCVCVYVCVCECLSVLYLSARLHYQHVLPPSTDAANAVS